MFSAYLYLVKPCSRTQQRVPLPLQGGNGPGMVLGYCWWDWNGLATARIELAVEEGNDALGGAFSMYWVGIRAWM